MAKINLLTLHYADNNGSVLQAYATCKILRDMGHEVTVINLQNRSNIIKRYNHPSNWIDIPRYLRFWIFRRRYLSPMTKIMFDIQSELIPTCDYTVVGSDQTWNADFKVVQKGTYFLNFVDDTCSKISLSSSFGKASWDASPEFTEYVKKQLARFSAISVRERSGVDICNTYFNRSAEHLLDPTLALGDFSELLDMTPRIENEIRCFLFKSEYSLDVIDFVSTKEKLPVCKLNRKGRKNYRKSDYWNSSPVKWMRLIRDAKIWISDSFHGIAFGILFKKQFIALCNDERKLERVHSLLSLLELQDKLVYSLDDLKKRYSEIMTPIDYDRVAELLKKEQDKFYSFIKKHIH